MLPEYRVGGMPDTLPAEDTAARFDLRPFGIKRVAVMTEPFGTKLPGAAMGAALHQQLVLAQSRPIGRGQPIGFRHWNRQPLRKISQTCLAAHNVASEPRRRLLTGVTIGPPITMATSFRFTWLVDVPRTCRTASSTSSRPCM